MIDLELVMYIFVTDLATYLVNSTFKEKEKEAYWHLKAIEILKVCFRRFVAEEGTRHDSITEVVKE